MKPKPKKYISVRKYTKKDGTEVSAHERVPVRLFEVEGSEHWSYRVVTVDKMTPFSDGSLDLSREEADALCDKLNSATLEELPELIRGYFEGESDDFPGDLRDFMAGLGVKTPAPSPKQKNELNREPQKVKGMSGVVGVLKVGKTYPIKPATGGTAGFVEKVYAGCVAPSADEKTVYYFQLPGEPGELSHFSATWRIIFL